jgi:hypothetical protein
MKVAEKEWVTEEELGTFGHNKPSQSEYVEWYNNHGYSLG